MLRIGRREFIGGAASLAAGIAAAPLMAEPRKTKVVIVTCPDVIDRNRPVNTGALRRMFEAGIMRLSGRNDVADAWKTFITPADAVALADSGTWLLNVPEVVAEAARGILLASPQSVSVTYCSLDTQHPDWMAQMRAGVTGAGVPPEALDGAVYTIPSNFHRKRFTALVMTPTLKSHSIAGVSGVVKHFATMSRGGPAPHHPNAMETAGSVIIPEFGHMSHLVIVDALRFGELTRGPKYFQKSLIFGTDPVAADMVALDLFLEHNAPYGDLPPERHRVLADTRYHAGISDRSQIEVVRLTV